MKAGQRNYNYRGNPTACLPDKVLPNCHDMRPGKLESVDRKADNMKKHPTIVKFSSDYSDKQLASRHMRDVVARECH